MMQRRGKLKKQPKLCIQRTRLLMIKWKLMKKLKKRWIRWISS